MMASPSIRTVLLIIAIGGCATLSILIAAPTRPEAPFADLRVSEAAWDDTSRLLGIRKITGTLTAKTSQPGTLTLAAALYHAGGHQRTIEAGGIELRTSPPHELRFVAAAIDSDHLRLGDASPETTRLSMTLSASGGGVTATAGPGEPELADSAFDVDKVRGYVYFRDRHLPEAEDEPVVIPLAAWMTGKGPVGTGTDQPFDMDEFALDQFEAGEGDERTVLVWHLKWEPSQK